MVNILTSLSAGSGIDVKALTEQLVAAETEPRQKLLDTRVARVEARISALGQFRSALDALVTALDTRLRSGALSGIPQVSDSTVLSFTVSSGATVARQSLEVRQLARGQTLSSAPVADPAASIGTGTLTIRFGQVAGSTDAGAFTPGTAGSLVVPITAGDSSLDGIRAAINDAAAVAGAPIQAQIVTDSSGARLLLRGASGESSGFIVESSDAGLAGFRFAQGITGGLSRTQAAADALVAIDGVEIRRSANVITDLVPGARLALAKAAPGQPITIEASRSADNIAQSVRDVASALNELAALGRQLAAGSQEASGALAADGATRRALQQLGRLASTALVSANGSAPTRLAEIGLVTDRNGTFQVDEARLAAAVAASPGAIEAMLTALNANAAGGQPAGPLRQIASGFAAAASGSAGQPTALEREKAALAREQSALDDRAARSRTAYTRQFSALDLAVGRSRALQTYLQQQIDLWTRSTS